MHVRTSIVEFLRTGRIGRIGLDTPRGEITRRFGSPNWREDNEHGSFWLYGSVEFGFGPGPRSYEPVRYIQIETGETKFEPCLRLGLSAQGFAPAPTALRFERLLTQNHIRAFAVDIGTVSKGYLTEGGVLAWIEADGRISLLETGIGEGMRLTGWRPIGGLRQHAGGERLARRT